MREPVQWPTVDLLTHRVRSTPDRTALVAAESGITWSYREYHEYVAELAGGLDRFVDHGDRVAVISDSRVAVATLTFAAWRIGASAVPLPTNAPRGDTERLIDRVNPACVVCNRGTERIAVAVSAAPAVSIDEPQSADATELDRDRSPPDPAPLSRDDEALVVFTSGTTGDRKGVRLTVGNLVTSATGSAFRLGVRSDDRWLLTLPTHHVGGLSPVVRTTLYGTAVVILEGFDADRVVDAVAEYDVTCISLVPTQLRRLLDVGWGPPDRFRFVLLGGAAADEELLIDCVDEGIPVCPTYGLTEAASQVATAGLDSASERFNSVGQPLLGTDVTIVAADGSVRGPGETGEIVVDGPPVTPGYLDDERTHEAFGDHGLHTGDLGYRDESGFLSVVGRLDDRIVTGGENVDPDGVAEAIRRHPLVSGAVVVGVPDEEWGERVAALVVPDDGDVGIDTLDRHCRDVLAPHEVPKTIAVADALPRTRSGTVDRDAVVARLTDETD